MTAHRSDGERDFRTTLGEALDPQEIRSRNPSAVAMDVLYLFTTAFFTTLAVRGFWPAVIAATPLVGMLYFGWNSSRPFFVTQLVVIVLTVIATAAGLVPI
ncbi:hypothetical protein BRC81_16155 [Halobacteriales archaeon QS_1_68_20]|nr:MAG: hypothetical protein BRC81_16155 [Halobacteriales archaeon QS_1_68_20]